MCREMGLNPGLGCQSSCPPTTVYPAPQHSRLAPLNYTGRLGDQAESGPTPHALCVWCLSPGFSSPSSLLPQSLPRSLPPTFFPLSFFPASQIEKWIKVQEDWPLRSPRLITATVNPWTNPLPVFSRVTLDSCCFFFSFFFFLLLGVELTTSGSPGKRLNRWAKPLPTWCFLR